MSMPLSGRSLSRKSFSWALTYRHRVPDHSTEKARSFEKIFKAEPMRDPEANPFPASDSARREIWEMLVPRDIDAFLAADWAPVAGDFVETNFTGLNARFRAAPDEWRLSFPTLAAYRDEWLRQAQEAKAARDGGLYAENARAAIFRATRLEEIELSGAAALVRKRFAGGIRRVDGGLDRMNWQTLYICRLDAGRWKIAGFVGYLPNVSD
jgi:hypothetical protein